MSYKPKDINKYQDVHPEQIKSIALYIKRTLIKEPYETKEDYYKEDFANFKEKFPTLYEKACDNSVDVGDFARIISMMTAQLSNTDDDYTRSATVGQVLYNRFIKDKEQFMKRKDG